MELPKPLNVSTSNLFPQHLAGLANLQGGGKLNRKLLNQKTWYPSRAWTPDVNTQKDGVFAELFASEV
jgi:hypothetical protein